MTPQSLSVSLGIELALVPAGSFLMGSPPDEPGREPEGDPEGPQHEVVISRPFYLGRCHVTQEQYERLTGANPSHFRRGGPGADQLGGEDTSRWPVETVSLFDAWDFCLRLSDLPQERAAGRAYRLPSEAEWEYACRAGTTTPYSFGADRRLLGDHACFARNSGYRPDEVGVRRPNAWGLYDMHGNVWDWVADPYEADYYRRSPRVDPPGPDEGHGLGVLRGGSWYSRAPYCRSAQRLRTTIDSGSFCIGFRVACSAPASSGGVALPRYVAERRP